MESEGSLPCLQEPATGPFPEPDELNPHFPTLFPWVWYKYYLLIYT